MRRALQVTPGVRHTREVRTTSAQVSAPAGARHQATAPPPSPSRRIGAIACRTTVQRWWGHMASAAQLHPGVGEFVSLTQRHRAGSVASIPASLSPSGKGPLAPQAPVLSPGVMALCHYPHGGPGLQARVGIPPAASHPRLVSHGFRRAVAARAGFVATMGCASGPTLAHRIRFRR